MKEYQSDGDIVGSVNDLERATPVKRIAESTPTAAAVPLSNSRIVASDALVDNLNFTFRSHSLQSLLSTSSLSLTHSAFDYWPEFQQNYHSIMDNTNLLDSCAAALSDITYDDDDSSGGSSSSTTADHRHRTLLVERTVLSSAGSSSVSLATKSVSAQHVEQFARWLDEMEARVADQPMLSQIFAMSASEMATQLKVHSKLFNDIVAQPCIVNGSKRKEHKLMEERYHLLYLKAYEVQLLLEGLPGGDNIDDRTCANRILNKSFYDFDEFNHVSEDDEVDGSAVNATDDCDATNEMDKQCQSEQTDDKQGGMSTRTDQTNKNVAMFYFVYEPPEERDQKQAVLCLEVSDDSESGGSDRNAIIDNALLPIKTDSFATLYDNELRLYLNESDIDGSIDTNGIVSDCADLDKTESTTQPQHFTEETLRFSHNTRLWNDLDFSPAIRHSSGIERLESDTEPCSKVRNWLYSKTERAKAISSMSLDRVSGSDTCRLLYRSRSELNLSARRKSFGSLRSSSNGLASAGAMKSDSGSSVADGSLEWDFYQQQADEHTLFDVNDFVDGDIYGDMARNLCEFGNDYSLCLSSSTISLDTDGGDFNAEPQSESICNEKTTGDSVTTAELVTVEADTQRQKRIRRQRKKRAKKRKQKPSPADADSMVSSGSTSTQSAANTSAGFDSFVQESKPKETSTPSAPSKTIKYDSSANQFHVYSDELQEPKLLKVSELRPEDFQEVVNMCQNNIDCVITVLGAKPNQILTVAYCRRMKYERNNCGDPPPVCQCEIEKQNAKNKKKTKSSSSQNECHCCEEQSGCICSWVEQTIAMILNFLMDCWNIFRNMKLYAYLCRVLKSLFGSTRYVADHLKMKSELTKLNTLKYW